jgi:hypothetical protein
MLRCGNSNVDLWLNYKQEVLDVKEDVPAL